MSPIITTGGTALSTTRRSPAADTASHSSGVMTTVGSRVRVAAMRDAAIRSAGTLSRPKACVSLFRSPRRIRRSSPHSIPEVNQAAIARSGRGLLKSATCSMRRTRDIAPTRRLGGKVGSDERGSAGSAPPQAAKWPRSDRYARRVLSAMLASTRAETSSRTGSGVAFVQISARQVSSMAVV
jgi:hypothetical protein